MEWTTRPWVIRTPQHLAKKLLVSRDEITVSTEYHEPFSSEIITCTRSIAHYLAPTPFMPWYHFQGSFLWWHREGYEIFEPSSNSVRINSVYCLSNYRDHTLSVQFTKNNICFDFHYLSFDMCSTSILMPCPAGSNAVALWGSWHWREITQEMAISIP